MTVQLATKYTAQSTLKLGVDLMKQVTPQQRNYCISPFSISACLQLALIGAKGTTLTEGLSATGITAPDRNQLANDYHNLAEYLQSPPTHSTFEGPGAQLEFNIANSLWAHNQISLQQDYVNALAGYYDAICSAINFGDPSSIATINSWVENKTNSKIRDLIKELDPLALLVLINCAYFKARWHKVFNKQSTTQQPFFNLQNQQLLVDMMYVPETRARYFENDQIQMIELKYTDDRFAMIIVLPQPHTHLINLTNDLSDSLFSEWQSQLSERDGMLQLPKFKIEYELKMSENLKALGMVEAFQKTADFSNIIQPVDPSQAQFWINEVIHKTFIDVDEEGTEAAAATAMTMWGGAGHFEIPNKFQMVVNRPFMYAITERNTGALLFAGQVFDPRV